MSLQELAMLDDGDDCAFDQACRFGHRCGSHAVYCHNAEWSDAPSKCRRTWYTGGEVKDEDCPGFAAQQAQGEAVAPFGFAYLSHDREGKEVVDLVRNRWTSPLGKNFAGNLIFEVPLYTTQPATVPLSEHEKVKAELADALARLAQYEGAEVVAYEKCAKICERLMEDADRFTGWYKALERAAEHIRALIPKPDVEK